MAHFRSRTDARKLDAQWRDLKSTDLLPRQRGQGIFSRLLMENQMLSKASAAPVGKRGQRTGLWGVVRINDNRDGSRTVIERSPKGRVSKTTFSANEMAAMRRASDALESL